MLARAANLPADRIVVLSIEARRLHAVDLTIGDPLLSELADDEVRQAVGQPDTPLTRSGTDTGGMVRSATDQSVDDRPLLEGARQGLAHSMSNLTLNVGNSSSGSARAGTLVRPSQPQALPPALTVTVAFLPGANGSSADALAAAEEFVLSFARAPSPHFGPGSPLPADPSSHPTLMLGKQNERTPLAGTHEAGRAHTLRRTAHRKVCCRRRVFFFRQRHPSECIRTWRSAIC